MILDTDGPYARLFQGGNTGSNPAGRATIFHSTLVVIASLPERSCNSPCRQTNRAARYRRYIITTEWLLSSDALPPDGLDDYLSTMFALACTCIAVRAS